MLIKIDCNSSVNSATLSSTNCSPTFNRLNQFSDSSISKKSEEVKGCFQSIWNCLKSLWEKIANFFSCCSKDIIPKEFKDDSIKELLKSSEKTQQLYTFDDYKFGIIFNPKGEALKIGGLTISDPIAVISDKELPVNIVKQINDQMPAGYTHSIFQSAKWNGQPIFKFFGFE